MKLLSVEQFNNSLKKCKLSKRDAGNRPNCFKTRKIGSKYEGGAGQLRVLSRVVTLILADVLDQSGLAGDMIIKLQEVAEVITAPIMTEYEIDYVMSEIITCYLDMRVDAITEIGMMKARPKHHYLAHYCECYKNYGPLISLWSMRMESKHCFFKSVVKASKNFKNSAKTCATRHEFAQLSFMYYGLFPLNKFETSSSAVSCREYKGMFPASDKYLRMVEDDALILKSLKIYGTEYIPGMLLVLGKESHGVLKVGLIRLITLRDESVSFGCSVFISKQSRDNYYVSTEDSNLFEMTSYEALQDYHPLLRVGPVWGFKFSLHHFISSRCT